MANDSRSETAESKPLTAQRHRAEAVLQSFGIGPRYKLTYVEAVNAMQIFARDEAKAGIEPEGPQEGLDLALIVERVNARLPILRDFLRDGDFDNEDAAQAILFIEKLLAEILRLRSASRTTPEGTQVTGETSDGYHTFTELYAYRKAYNALLFNEWAARGVYGVHKSEKHHDGELCFGGGWFIVSAQTPVGQVSNHYKMIDWPLFQVQTREFAAEWDGHTPAIALERLLALAASRTTPEPTTAEDALFERVNAHQVATADALSEKDQKR